MAKKTYTFNVCCSFEMQFTFRDDEVEPCPDGGETDVEPTDEALEALQRELEEYLSKHYVVSEIDASAEPDSLLGTQEE